MFGFDLDIVVSGSNVEFGEDFGVLDCSKKVLDIGQGK